MSDNTAQFLRTVGNWKVAMVSLLCHVITGLAGSLTMALNGVDWNAYTGTQKFLVYVACASVVATNINAFFSTAAADAKKKTTDQTNQTP